MTVFWVASKVLFAAKSLFLFSIICATEAWSVLRVTALLFKSISELILAIFAFPVVVSSVPLAIAEGSTIPSSLENLLLCLTFCAF